LWIFGQKTTEIWYNAGDPLFPFARVPGATLNLGCLAPESVVKFSNTIMWLGADANGFVQVYLTNGTNPQRVSNFAIENAICGITTGAPAGNMDSLPLATAYAYQEAGHTFYCLNILDISYGFINQYVYDLTTGMWHERQYAGDYPTCYANVPGTIFNVTGPSFVGGASNKIYYQGLGYPSDAGTAINYSRTCPASFDRNKFVKYPMVELLADMGSATVTLGYSNDGGKTFPYTYGPISASGETQNGARGRYIWRQLGRSRDRVFKFYTSSSTQLIRWIDAFIGETPGSEQ
jgi:hypothetical protein